jgi:hypothetical protein
MRRLGFHRNLSTSPLPLRHLSQVASIGLPGKQNDGRLTRPFAARMIFPANRAQSFGGRSSAPEKEIFGAKTRSCFAAPIRSLL